MSLGHCEAGDPEDATRFATKTLELSRKNNEKCYEGWAKSLLGCVRAKTQPSASSQEEAIILDGIRILEERRLAAPAQLAYRFLGELYSAIGEREKARTALQTAVRMGKDMGMVYWLDKAQELLRAVGET